MKSEVPKKSCKSAHKTIYFIFALSTSLNKIELKQTIATKTAHFDTFCEILNERNICNIFLLEFWSLSGAKEWGLRRSRKMLQNEASLAIVAVHTAENEPLKIWGYSFSYSVTSLRPARPLLGAAHVANMGNMLHWGKPLVTLRSSWLFWKKIRFRGNIALSP